MKPTRPIETFDKWYLHEVCIEVPQDRWNNIRRSLNSHGIVADRDYKECRTGYGRESIMFNFEELYHANWLCKRFKNKYHLWYRKCTHSQGPFASTPIKTNFTIEDFTQIFGDPLDPRAEFILRQYELFAGDYFKEFHFMHHADGRKWWPVAFVYFDEARDPERNAKNTERVLWCKENGVAEFAMHKCGMWEFGNRDQAMLFKLTFGESRLPK